MGSLSFQCRLESKGVGTGYRLRLYDGVRRGAAIFMVMTVWMTWASCRGEYLSEGVGFGVKGVMAVAEGSGPTGAQG